MAVKIILTQIMKNETKVIKRMLDSVLGFIDGIAIVDTGSTDDSIEIVKKWGVDNNVETYISEHHFDDYSQSRNRSIDLAREKFLSKKDGHTYYGFWLDADEVLQQTPKFVKSDLSKDIYMIDTQMNGINYTRNELYKLAKPFFFKGVIHEYLACEDDKATSGLLVGASVFVHSDGATWQDGSTAKKYRHHAAVFEEYIDNVDRDPRWVFYTGQSYFDSATLPNDKEENIDRLSRAIKYYRERVNMKGGYAEERYYAQYRIGLSMVKMEKPWKDSMEEYLKAYSIDPMRAEPIRDIVEYYISVKEWNLAYIYSKFGKVNHHGKCPYPQKLLFIEQDLYHWRFLELHSVICHNMGKLDEAKSTFNDMVSILKKNPEYFTIMDKKKIESNAKFFA